MKNIALFVVLLPLFAACKKDEPAGADVAGAGSSFLQAANSGSKAVKTMSRFMISTPVARVPRS